MNTEETKTEQEQADSPTFAQRIESITDEWKESILQDTIRIIEDGRMTEEDVENIVENFIDNSSDLDYKIEGRIDDYNMDDKIERWIDYNLDIEDKVDDVLRYYDWDNVMDEIDISRFMRRIKHDLSNEIAEQVEDAVENARTEDNPIHRVEAIEGRINAILNILDRLGVTVYNQTKDLRDAIERGDA